MGATKNTNNGRKGGNLAGKPHYDKEGNPTGGIKAVITDNNRPVELEGGEVIINKKAAKKHWRKLSEINQSEGNGVPITEPQFGEGGKIEIVMKEFADGKLYDSHGKKVTQKAQALAIAYSEQRKHDQMKKGGNAEAKKPKAKKEKKVVEAKVVSKSEKTNLENSKVTNWADVPNIWKQYKSPSELHFDTYGPTDKAIGKLSDSFSGEDNLRPVMAGVYYDSNGISMTDAHRVLFINKKTKHEGIYACSRYALQNVEYDKRNKKIEGKYPQYQAVIPKEKHFISAEIQVEKLYSYLFACMPFVNQTTHNVGFAFGKELTIGFNAKFLQDVCRTFLSMGHKTMYAGFSTPNQAGIFAVDKSIAQNPSKVFEQKDAMLVLLMPVMLNIPGDDYTASRGAEDLDFTNELVAYFDFKDAEIHNQDESVALFNPDEEIYPDYITKEQLDIIAEALPRNDALPIVETVHIENGVARVTDLETETILQVSDKIATGCYIYLNGYLRKTDINPDDFPVSAKVEDKKGIAIISSAIFQKELAFANLFTGKDDLRPVFNCVHLEFVGGQMKVISTNSHLLYKNSLSVEMREAVSFAIENPKLIANILSALSVEQPLTISLHGDKKFMITTDTAKIIGRVFDGKYPTIDSITPTKFTHLIEIEKVDLIKAIEGIKSADNVFLSDNALTIGQAKLRLGARHSVEKIKDASADTKSGILIAGISNTLKAPLMKLPQNTITLYATDKSTKLGGEMLWLPILKSYSNTASVSVKKTPTKEVKSEKEEWTELHELAVMMFAETKDAEQKEWKDLIELSKMFI